MTNKRRHVRCPRCKAKSETSEDKLVQGVGQCPQAKRGQLKSCRWSGNSGRPVEPSAEDTNVV